MAGAMLPARRSERRIAEQKERNVTLRGTGYAKENGARLCLALESGRFPFSRDVGWSHTPNKRECRYATENGGRYAKHRVVNLYATGNGESYKYREE